ncbi:hypothetical protein BDA96_08G014600 [Sorghum bicolor]|uniref:Uncharacterized protein n=1 Tax=Sorghum bicolor TaxID=4558 RepID=A0A921U5Q2_SORBI|nr:hypothetical protein BDA96_08G014600 [Sorghum bicolor]
MEEIATKESAALRLTSVQPHAVSLPRDRRRPLSPYRGGRASHDRQQHLHHDGVILNRGSEDAALVGVLHLPSRHAGAGRSFPVSAHATADPGRFPAVAASTRFRSFIPIWCRRPSPGMAPGTAVAFLWKKDTVLSLP